MIVNTALFIGLSVIFAGIHANVINEGRGRGLKKWAWAFLYFGIAVLLSWLKGKHDGIQFDWWTLANAFCIRVPFFNIPLNRFRKPPKPWFYFTPELKNVMGWGDAWGKGRFWDYFFWKITGKRVWIVYAVFLAAAVFINIYRYSLNININ